MRGNWLQMQQVRKNIFTPFPADHDFSREAEPVQTVLARMTPGQLTAAVKERQQASLDPLKTEYAETVARLEELAKKITGIGPTWEPSTPPTVPERILSRVKGQGKPVSKAEIMAGLKTK